MRFHDGRHTAITTLAEKGLPDWVIQAQVGHVAPEMMKTYSHIRRQALNQAADALEPNAPASPAPPPTNVASATIPAPAKRVMSHGTSQNAGGRGRIVKFSRKYGSSGWIRTSNPPVNSNHGAWAPSLDTETWPHLRRFYGGFWRERPDDRPSDTKRDEGDENQ